MCLVAWVRLCADMRVVARGSVLAVALSTWVRRVVVGHMFLVMWVWYHGSIGNTAVVTWSRLCVIGNMDMVTCGRKRILSMLVRTFVCGD